MKKIFDTVVIGGGASGLMCALRLAERGVRDVLLLERNDRVGRKLSVTGNGQGNVTNTDMSAQHYFGSGRETVAAVLKQYGEKWLVGELTSLGGLFAADGTGRVYPASRQASAVTDLFRFALAEREVAVRTGEKVVRVRRADSGFAVQTASAEYRARALVLACGGKAASYLGTEGDGYAFAESFGHTVTSLRPSLVQLKTDKNLIKGLKGLRCECAAALLRGGKEIARTRGDVLFGDGTLSGDAAFRLSAFCAEGDLLRLDFLPDHSQDMLARLLSEKAARVPALPCGELLRCIVSGALARCLLQACSIPLQMPAGQAQKKLAELAGAVKGYALPVLGTLGFEKAQATKGGVRMEELTARLESKKAAGLYIVGELCDVDGECGGYNLQWAFSSGACAADAIAEKICG